MSSELSEQQVACILITLSPRTDWVLNALHKGKGDEKEELQAALDTYRDTIIKHHDGEWLFSGFPGKRPRPVNLIKLDALTELPAEASLGQSRQIVIVGPQNQITQIHDLRTVTRAGDPSEVVSNALFFVYRMRDDFSRHKLHYSGRRNGMKRIIHPTAESSQGPPTGPAA